MTQCFCSSGFCDAARPWALGEILATMGQIPHQIPRPQPPPHSQLRSDIGSKSGLETVKDKFANQCCFSYHVQFCRFAAFTFCCSSQTVQCDIVDSKMIDVREDICSKKTFSFGHCPNVGGGGLPMPEFFGPFFHHVFPYILTSISCYLILFGHF